MDQAGLLVEVYGRVLPLARATVDGLTVEQVLARPTPDANPIAWLLWHLARVQDHHVSELLETDQLWVTDGWAPRFGLAPDPDNTGYGHSSAEVAAVRPERPEVLVEHLEAVDARTRPLLEGCTADDLDRIVDRRWDPPVTLGVRLVSVVDDCLQHIGQAAYVRGLIGA